MSEVTLEVKHPVITESDRKGMAIQQLLDRCDNEFTYHAPKPGQAEMYETLRAKAKDYAKFIVRNTPVSREQSVALTKLREVMFWANAAIACNE